MHAQQFNKIFILGGSSDIGKALLDLIDENTFMISETLSIAAENKSIIFEKD